MQQRPDPQVKSSWLLERTEEIVQTSEEHNFKNKIIMTKVKLKTRHFYRSPLMIRLLKARNMFIESKFQI